MLRTELDALPVEVEVDAAGGLPILMDWLEGGVQTPMVSVTKNLIRFLTEKAP